MLNLNPANRRTASSDTSVAALSTSTPLPGAADTANFAALLRQSQDAMPAPAAPAPTPSAAATPAAPPNPVAPPPAPSPANQPATASAPAAALAGQPPAPNACDSASAPASAEAGACETAPAAKPTQECADAAPTASDPTQPAAGPNGAGSANGLDRTLQSRRERAAEDATAARRRAAMGAPSDAVAGDSPAASAPNHAAKTALAHARSGPGAGGPDPAAAPANLPAPLAATAGHDASTPDSAGAANAAPSGQAAQTTQIERQIQASDLAASPLPTNDSAAAQTWLASAIGAAAGAAPGTLSKAPDALGGASGAAARAQTDLAGLSAASGTLAPTPLYANAAAVSVTFSTPVNSPSFAQDLGLQLSVLARDGVQKAELHLNPSDMGPISVQIAMDGTQARVDFGADVAATRQAIEAGIPELASALRDAGFTLAGGGVSQHSRGRGDTDSSNPQGTPRVQRAASDATLARVHSAAQRVASGGGLDLFA